MSPQEPAQGRAEARLAGADRHYRRISLEFSSTWPGKALLRFEPHSGGAVMVEMAPGDVDVLGSLLRSLALNTAGEVRT